MEDKLVAAYDDVPPERRKAARKVIDHLRLWRGEPPMDWEAIDQDIENRRRENTR